MGKRISLARRLTASIHNLDAEDLQDDVERLNCRAMQTLERGSYATVAGRVRSVVYTPTEHLPLLTAELFDGSAAIELVWLGQRRIAGIEPGRRLIARGRVGVHDGKLAIYNPWYELVGAA